MNRTKSNFIKCCKMVRGTTEMQLDKPFGFDKKGASIKQNRITTQQIIDGVTQMNGRNIVMGKVVDLNQVLYGYTISDSRAPFSL